MTVNWKIDLSPAQRRLVLASGPSDRDPEDGHGVEIRGAQYATARKLQESGLGTYSHGSPYGDLYFNNADGLAIRGLLLRGAADRDPSGCENCDGFGCVWNNADPTSGQMVPCDVCGDERGQP